MEGGHELLVGSTTQRRSGSCSIEVAAVTYRHEV